MTTRISAQIHNEIYNFPFKKGKAIIKAYNGENVDTAFRVENLTLGDTIRFSYDPNGQRQTMFLFIFNSDIGELSMLLATLQNKSINKYQFSTEGSMLMTYSSSEFNLEMFESLKSLDSILSVDFNSGIHLIESYKNQEIYFYFMTMLMPLMDESNFKSIDTAFNYALQGKATYWKKQLVESYYKFKKLTPEIFQSDNMMVLNSENSTVLITSLLDSTRDNIIYVWASWCVPCLKKLKSLSAQMDSINQSTNLILISIDKDKNAWKKATMNLKYPYQHYLVKNNDEFTKNLFINSVPQSFRVRYFDMTFERVEF